MNVLLTGANGYIGRRLKHRLLQDNNIKLKILVRNKSSLLNKLNNVEVVEGSSFDLDSLRKALSGVDVAYYFIHSLTSQNYQELDKQSAKNFLDIALECGVKKIIYL